MTDDNLFRATLLAAHKDKRLVCVYRNAEDLDRFAVGRVAAVGLEDYRLEHVNRYGLPDGVSVERIEDLLLVETDTRYTRQIALLLDQREAIWDAGAPADENPAPTSADLARAELERSRREERVISVHVATEDDTETLSGVVRLLTATHARMERLTEDGEPDGLATFLLEDVVGVEADGFHERRLGLFNRHRTDLYL